jgi:hypothetical protein
MPDAQVRPALHVLFVKHEHFSSPSWQLEPPPPPPQPAPVAKAVPSIDARKRHLLTKIVSGIEILISNSPFMMQPWGEQLPPVRYRSHRRILAMIG